VPEALGVIGSYQIVPSSPLSLYDAAPTVLVTNVVEPDVLVIVEDARVDVVLLVVAVVVVLVGVVAVVEVVVDVVGAVVL
jgi:hypothetical protein